jgi:hypothetical protein
MCARILRSAKSACASDSGAWHQPLALALISHCIVLLVRHFSPHARPSSSSRAQLLEAGIVACVTHSIPQERRAMRPALRVTVSAHHSGADVQRLADALKAARVPLASGSAAAADAPQNSARKRKSTSSRA